MHKQSSSEYAVKADAATGRFAGYASLFDVVDKDRDVVQRGAFAKSLRVRPEVKLLWQHDAKQPIGVFTKIVEDARGLFVEGQLLLEVQAAREAYALLKGGAINGLLIGYRVADYTLDPATGYRRLHAVDLLEISLVTFPANEKAVVGRVKYSPDQPRDDQGRWTEGGGGGSVVSRTGAQVAEANAGQARVRAPHTYKPAKARSLSRDGIQLIVAEESFRSRTYLDVAGRATIGYGHKIRPGESFPNGVSKEEARQLFLADTREAQRAVQDLVKVPITQGQYNVLTSLAYNSGRGNFVNSDVLRRLNQGDYNGAADELLTFNRIRVLRDGKLGPKVVNAGLTNRRRRERAIFLGEEN